MREGGGDGRKRREEEVLQWVCGWQGGARLHVVARGSHTRISSQRDTAWCTCFAVTCAERRPEALVVRVVERVPYRPLSQTNRMLAEETHRADVAPCCLVRTSQCGFE